MTARQFLSPDLGSQIRSALVESGVGPELLEVEITESSIMQDTTEATRTLEYLESALPANLSEKLWPLIDVEQAATPTRKPRKPEDLVAALTRPC